MTDSIVFDGAVNMLHKALNISSERHRVLAGNIANVDTIGYSPKDVDFKKTFENALESPQNFNLTKTHQKHSQVGAADNRSFTVEYSDQSKETVDIDQEMTHLAENNLQFRTNLEMMLRKMSTIRYSITEGGR